MVSFKGLENITYDIKVKFVVSDAYQHDFTTINLEYLFF